jgi:hypothetical protein
VETAKYAVEAQFQAHTCLDLHFCNESHHMVEWVENHSFGPEYPSTQPLPIEACKHEKARAALRRGAAGCGVDAFAGQATPQQSELLCHACSAAVEVDIQRGECMPQFTTLQPGSLQERVGWRREPFLCG